MITEKGTLPIGFEKDGQVHVDFELRPQLVGDAIDVCDEQPDSATDNSAFFGACLLAKQIVRIGEISPVTVEDLRKMYEEDGRELRAASGRLAGRLKSFREEDGKSKKDASGAS